MNDILYERALEVINKLYNDKSVTKEQAIENLENLKEEIDILIEILDLAKEIKHVESLHSKRSLDGRG
jgi:hypothetical protein